MNLSDLAVSGHTEADESFVEGRRVGTGNVQRLVPEHVLRYLHPRHSTHTSIAEKQNDPLMKA